MQTVDVRRGPQAQHEGGRDQEDEREVQEERVDVVHHLRLSPLDPDFAQRIQQPVPERKARATALAVG